MGKSVKSFMMRNEEKIEFVLLLIVIFQIFLLINITFADSYLINQSNDLINNLNINTEQGSKVSDLLSDLVNSGINLLIGFLSIKQIGIVSAQSDVSWYCCPNTCDSIPSNYNELGMSCPNSVEPLPSSCDAVQECRKGCCFDSENGLCSTNSPRGSCIDSGGEWNEDESCSINECRKGCCILGGNAQFTTERSCEIVSDSLGYTKDFRQIWNEIECLTFAASQTQGACVLNVGNCRFITQRECLMSNGRFYGGYLCSHPDLNTNCIKQDHVGCAEGKNEIYWYDSCGNRENIYSSNKIASWNNGIVLPKENSCDTGSGNVNSQICGNCALPLSKCSATATGQVHIQDGNFICKDLGCKNAPANVGTQDRINGETWCLYDSSIGNAVSTGGSDFASDTVGSEHWIASCHEGEVEIDRCGEYRSSICQEQIIEEGAKSLTMASCVPNQATVCISYNPLQEEGDGEMVDNDENIQNCQDNTHCMIENVDTDDYFQFKMCVPRYPKGASLTNDIDDSLCSIANQKCTVYYRKKITGWECEENCDCETPEFAEKMNNLCVSIGDCGSYINYVGEGTDNVKIEGKKGKELDSEGEEKDKESKEKGDAPSIFSWTNYIKFATPVFGQHVEPQSIDEFLSLIGESPGVYDLDSSKIYNMLGTVSGALGAGWMLNAFIIKNFGVLINIGAVGVGILNSIGFAAIGVAATAMLAKWLGISGPAAIVMVVSGGVAGAGVAMILWSASGANFWNILGWVLAAIGVIIVAIIAIFGLGKTETRIVEFTCQPWQAPTFDSYTTAQNNCEKCNQDPLRPCTKYRCESLGATCRILNENEENPICESLQYESNPPVISPGQVLTQGYQFQNQEPKKVEITSTIGGCIQEFTSVFFTLETDEPAQCKYSFEIPLSTYQDMDNNYPFEQNMFTEKHSFEIWMPSLESAEVYNVSGSLVEQLGQMNMYVRCKDYWENFNIDEYIVKFCINSEPDRTVVNHGLTVTNPRNGATLRYGTNETDLKMWINEPAECKYDLTAGKDYEQMTNSMDCKIGFVDRELQGWPCTTELTNLTSGENKIYIRCKDKPWVETAEDVEKYGERNVNQQDYVYTLYVSQNELKIDSITFNTIPSGGTISSGSAPVSVNMEVKTSGGISNGKATCHWGVLQRGSRWLFYDTFSNVHRQLLTDKMGGTYNIYIECEDDAENEVNTEGRFALEIDSSPPKAVRLFQEENSLKMITDEEAKCYYSPSNCFFDFDDENVLSMTTAFSKEHIANWNQGQKYHIKCEDLWGNINQGCAITVSLI